MRIAIIGLGAIANEFIPAIDGDAATRLTAVCDLDVSRTARFDQEGVGRYASHEELIRAQVCDAAVVALPNDQHVRVVRDLLEAGLHVVCEKPLTVLPADAEALVDLATRRQLVLRTAFHRRFNRNLIALTQRVRGRAAPVTAVRVRYHEDIREHTGGETWYLDKERCGGGCVIDNGPNALDMARAVVGEMVLEDCEFGDVRGGLEHYAQLRLSAGSGASVEVELDWAWEGGELKDIEVEFEDGATDRANMLDGFTEFKGSLAHEYEGIIADFVRCVQDGDDGLSQTSIVETVARAAHVARRRHTRLRMASKLDVETRVIRTLFHETDRRGMVLGQQGSACFSSGEIHELVVTTDCTDIAGGTVDHVGYLGFIEFRAGAMITRGDTFWYDGACLGEFAGVDESHMPNHLNIILRSERVITAEDVDLRPGDAIVIREGRQREFLESDDPGAWSNQGPSSGTVTP
ncbi:Gfo/Idh/MocA family oxidoreductase [Clavibacter sp. VKM Ac-2872]|nr:Gfo/Idh/MocA family oxidoreductase [Clavibacter sp. VKM Ac-2872]